MFSTLQRDILRVTLEWARYNDGQEVEESYDFIDDPAWDQRNWFSVDGSRSPFVEEVDSWVDGRGVDSLVDGCGTTACIAGYIVYATRHLREDEDPVLSEEIRDYAAWVLEIPEEWSEWLFGEYRALVDIIDCLEETLGNDHW